MAGEVAPDGKLRIDPGAQRQEAPLAELELAQALRRDTIRVCPSRSHVVGSTLALLHCATLGCRQCSRVGGSQPVSS